jgi:hypothetical protein
MGRITEGCNITIHRFGEGVDQTIEIPNPDLGSSAIANAWQLAVIRAICDVGEKFGRAKADALGEDWPEV